MLAAATASAAPPRAFEQRCAVCHQPSGAGIAGLYPPLAGTVGSYLKVPAGRAYLIHLLLYGMNGDIKSGGTSYQGWMPPAADFSDSELADALNYVMREMNGDDLPRGFKPFTAGEFKAAREAKISPGDVHREREKVMAELAAAARDGGGAR
jgi:mono/diheme cytochrome c family protein